MLISIDVSMQYQLGNDPMVLLTVEAARTEGQTVISDNLYVDSAEVSRVDGEGGLGTRIWANVQAPQLQLRYQATVETQRPVRPLEDFAANPLHDLPGKVLSYIRPSRFCQSDMFMTYVSRRFGHLEGGAKVAAIRDWVANEMTYVPASSNADTTALDTFATREGVCRDYAHMVCALARAANIPARYASVYGVGVTPPDFHAVAQVWLGGEWQIVDATGMCEADGVVLVATGRDASDVAFMQTAAPAQVINQFVSVEKAAPQAK